MAKHQAPEDGSRYDGKATLNADELAELVEEPEGKHSADEEDEEE